MLKFSTAGFKSWLSTPVDASPVVLFRRIFGILMIFEMIYMINIGFVDIFIFTPILHLKYDFFEWLQPLPQPLMRMVPFVILVAALFLAWGKKVRMAGIVFFICYLYLLLLEKGYYNNHLYLFCLLGVLFSFSGERKTSDGKSQLPNWVLRIVQFQVLVVYFYGGLAKLNPDWIIRNEPVITILKNALETDQPPTLLVLILTWGGLLFDLGIPFLLLFKRTRLAALFFILAFNISNIFLFNTGEQETIGIFPVLMISASLLFFPPEQLRKWLSAVGLKSSPLQKSKTQNQKAPVRQLKNAETNKAPFAFIAVYVLFQLLFPLRHYFIKGDVLWTGEGFYFSWAMKLRAGDFENKIWVRREPDGERAEIHPIGFLNTMQYSCVSQNPVDMWKACKQLVPQIKKRGVSNPIIQVTMWLGINGRPRQLVIDSTLNLPKAVRSPFRHAAWIREQEQ